MFGDTDLLNKQISSIKCSTGHMVLPQMVAKHKGFVRYFKGSVDSPC